MINTKNILAIIALASLSLAHPGKRDDEHITLGPGPVVPSGCYTATTTLPFTGQINCPVQPVCGPYPDCILHKEITALVPCKNDKCPVTPTATVTASGTCPTCQTGCATVFATTTATTGCSTTSSVTTPIYY
ncbi:hypothetical protein LHYA1_G005554 [Lachnellula hyalina]|uniref:Clock-controlled protein 6 n=1 Tax=Lachnellula hyalina TaxID=1316788 RepID=A0A8H8R0P5_9HELO|nr:uncharacterized protein LHYA1_G005554 [Lachnellula hyalina]TVY26402.1 hypothetical protein LHYA1_G005554 [Lachnellula hyalina]